MNTVDTKLASMEIYNDRLYIPAVLSFIDSIVSNHQAYDLSRYHQLRFVLAELLAHRVAHAFPKGRGKLHVELFLRNNCFEVSLRDKGEPVWVDFSYDEEKVTKERMDFRKYVLSKCVDHVGIEKLGKDGQRVYVQQEILNALEFTAPQPYQETEVLDTNISIRPVETEADAIEAIRCIYSEYGYSYAYEKLYYGDNLLRMIKNGEIMSFLAVNDHGQTAGHFALVFCDLFQGMPEISTVVIRKEFRGLGLFSKFIDHCFAVAEEKGQRALMAQPVAFHPYSQKAFVRKDFTATSLLLSYTNAEIESEYNKNNERLDLFACVKMIDKNAGCILYPPRELVPFVTGIYDRLGCGCTLLEEQKTAENSSVKMEINMNLKMKRLILKEAGEDIEEFLMDAVKDSIRQKHEMLELFLSLRTPTCRHGYQAAKCCHFALSGLLPGGENDDYIVMQLLLKNERRYDRLVTVGDFTRLTEDIVNLTQGSQKEDAQ